MAQVRRNRRLASRLRGDAHHGLSVQGGNPTADAREASCSNWQKRRSWPSLWLTASVSQSDFACWNADRRKSVTDRACKGAHAAQLRPPDIAPHRRQAAVTGMAHDLLVRDVIPIGNRDEPARTQCGVSASSVVPVTPAAAARVSTSCRTASGCRCLAPAVFHCVTRRKTGPSSMISAALTRPGAL